MGSLCASDGFSLLLCVARDYVTSTNSWSKAHIAYRWGPTSGEELLFPTKPRGGVGGWSIVRVLVY